jgi:hypothetical protein
VSTLVAQIYQTVRVNYMESPRKANEEIGMRAKQLWFFFLVVVFIFFLPPAGETSSPSQPAEWTVMVYMDGDNNLEEDALIDFLEMARVGSTNEVNVVVQFDRIGKYVSQTDDRFPYWTETLRFRVTKGMKPARESALKDQKLGEANMGGGKTLADFVAWTKRAYPAKRYALILWDHGQGWRGIISPTDEVLVMVSRSKINPLNQPAVGNVRLGFPFRTAIGSPLRSLSFDETNKDKLYNQEIQLHLQQVLKAEKLDLIAFDACLMAMVETAYAMRDVAGTMAASEELVPGTGFQYDEWLNLLTSDPRMDGPALGKVLVDSFEQRYGTASEFRDLNPLTTLSAVDLTKLDQLAAAITTLSKSLIAKFDSEKSNIRSARESCSVYAPDALGDGRDYFLHIDLARFCDELAARSRDQEIRNKAAAVSAIIRSAVLRNYAGTARRDTFGSHGLAIYFPPNASTYKKDWLKEDGYENSRTRRAGRKPPIFPVEFVEKHYWSDFLHVYFKHFRKS